MTESALVKSRLPATDRGRRTRAKLIDAARSVFETHDFRDALVRDITEKAGVAYGTFYTYFPTKESVVREVGLAVAREMMIDPEVPKSYDPYLTNWSSSHDASELASRRIYDRVLRANRIYLQRFQLNARLLVAIDHMALYNDELHKIRQDMRQAVVQRSITSVMRWQAEGLADPELDPVYAGRALGSMVYRFAYSHFVFGGDFDLETAAKNLSRLWVQALGMTVNTELPPSHDHKSSR